MEFDYIIIGGGTAGCILARRLSEDASISVLLIEAGGKDNYPWIHIPIGYAKTMYNPKYKWGFYTEPESELYGRKIYWPRGKVLGGSSSINGLIYIRGQPEDYDNWAFQGNTGWGWQDVLPYFKKLESNSRGASDYHGADGPLACSDIASRHELMDAIIMGGKELGVPYTDDFNGVSQRGVGYFQLFTRKGRRCSTAVGYLNPVKRRDNLTVWTSTRVTKIRVEAGVARGVEIIRDGNTRSIDARTEVILAAGTVQSPQLLELSGIGRADILAAASIPLKHELPGVGENLQDHLQHRLMFRCTKPITTNDEVSSVWRKFKMGVNYVLKRQGPMSVGINYGGMFTPVLPESQQPDVQFHFAALSADSNAGKPHNFPGFTFSVCQLRPESRGSIHVRSGDIQYSPEIKANYLSHERDLRCSIAGVRFALDLANTNNIKPYVLQPIQPQKFEQEKDIENFCRAYATTIYHPAGTCKMGQDDDSVVDERLKVHGMENLRVVDCSVMPTLVSGNTNAPVAMIAERASDFILQDR